MIRDVADLTSQDFSGGLWTIQDIFKIPREATPNAMNVKFDFDGKMGKRLGTNTRNAVALSAANSAGTLGVTTCGLGSFDFGAGEVGTRWLVTQGGTALWASSDMGVNWVRIASDRSITYQNFTRSRNVLVACSDAYDTVLAWAGSAGTNAFILNSSAPNAKYAITYGSYLILLNSNTRKRGFYYELIDEQLTADWSDSFDLDSSEDDEITGAFTVSNRLFVSTRYRIFNVSFVGGNPFWNVRPLKDWGFAPRTFDKITVSDFGEIAVGLDWSRRIRIFDGAEERIVSDNIENDNKMCEFATSKISYAGSGLLVSFGKTDEAEQVYKLGVAIGADSTQATHFICYGARTKAFYPYDYSNLGLMSMTMAESANRRYLVAVDQSGWIHLMDSGNLDRNTYAIDDVVDSPFLFEKSPSQTSKSNIIDMYFSVNSAGQIYYRDRTDFNTNFKTRRIFSVKSDGKILHHESIDIPVTANVYQYSLTSSSSTNDRWELNRVDFFLKGMGIGREIKG